MAFGEKPISTATPTTTATPATVCIVLPMTWPSNTEDRAIPIVRKRAMMPSVISIATEIAVPCEPPATAISIPGTT